MNLEKKIKVVHVSYAASKQTASYRLHLELLKFINSIIFVSAKSIKSPSIIQPVTTVQKLASLIGLLREKLIFKILPNNKKVYFSYNIGPVVFQFLWINRLFKLNTDIFHLHWIGNGFLNLNQIKKLNKPIVITLHDVWFLTGGCHVNLGCNKYQNGCNQCPLFKNYIYPFDITSHIFTKKLKVFKNKSIELVVLSQWMKDIVNTSAIFANCNINIIPNGLDTKKFKPYDKIVARNLFSINANSKIILFGGISAKNDFNKGYDLLSECLNFINTKNIELLVFGEKDSSKYTLNGFNIINVGYLSDDESLAMLYSAADLVIVPSRQESFSQVCLESISCGTPVVAFDYSGPRDIIVHKKNGYLATPYDPKDLAYGVDWVFKELFISNSLNLNAREFAEKNFDISKIADMHINMYNKYIKINR
jgi:glycosyltransferase involved in cell wall biosynthesis